MELKYQVIVRITGHDTVLCKRIRNLTGDIARRICHSPLLPYWLFNGGLSCKTETMKELKADRRYLYLTRDIYLYPFLLPEHCSVDCSGRIPGNVIPESSFVN